MTDSKTSDQTPVAQTPVAQAPVAQAPAAQTPADRAANLLMRALLQIRQAARPGPGKDPQQQLIAIGALADAAHNLPLITMSLLPRAQAEGELALAEQAVRDFPKAKADAAQADTVPVEAVQGSPKS
ncbi:hypothetical protein LDL36_16510 [Komagataeibacter sp. FNDCR1]|nr:hypothetical protein [Komagataeibacter sp. FNDCR1]